MFVLIVSIPSLAEAPAPASSAPALEDAKAAATLSLI